MVGDSTTMSPADLFIYLVVTYEKLINSIATPVFFFEYVSDSEKVEKNNSALTSVQM